VDLRPIGLWTFQVDTQPVSLGRELAAEIENLGYGALWLPEAAGRDAVVSATLLLGATQRLTLGTGVVPLYAREPPILNAAWKTLEDAYPGRFVLGIGVSHAPLVEGILGSDYGPPLATMRSYLERMDAAPFFAAPPPRPPRRVLAALGPKMLALAAERADGALTYNCTPEHTAAARPVMGEKMLAVEQKVALTSDPTEARDIARNTLRIYTGLPNYVNNWLRLGFGGDEISGLADRFVDAVVAWGDDDALRARVQAHLDAGADHVCVQVLSRDGKIPVEDWRRLAPVLVRR